MTPRLYIDTTGADFSINRKELERAIKDMGIRFTKSIHISVDATKGPGELGDTFPYKGDRSGLRWEIKLNPKLSDYEGHGPQFVNGGFKETPNATLLHELTHVKQFEGPDMVQKNKLYGLMEMIGGYRENPFEVDARENGKRLENSYTVAA